MKYTIITLGNPEREPHRQAIRDAMDGIEEARPKVVNGKDPEELRDHIDRWGFNIKWSSETNPSWRPGELGLWYSTLNAWNYAYQTNTDLMIFEDDAVPRPFFRETVDAVPPPEGYDFATYYTPARNTFQASRFRFEAVQQEHGNICVVYSPEGAEKCLDLVWRDGIEFPVDIWLYKQAKFRRALKGYGPKPTSQVIIDHDFTVPTNIHDDERITL